MVAINLKTRFFIRILIGVFLILLVAHVFVLILRYKIMPGSQFAERLDQFLNFDREVNFPTYFNTILLFLSAQTFLIIAYKSQYSKLYFKSYWYIMALGFLFLSVDEFIRIHEWFIEWTPRYLGVGGKGILKFAWIIPYGFITILFGIYSFKFLMDLQPKFRNGYIICGFMYLLGAIGVESVSGILFEENNDIRSFNYLLYYTTIEESLEMFALILLLKYNLNYLIGENKVTNIALIINDSTS